MVTFEMESSSKKQKKLSEKAPFEQVVDQLETLVTKLEQGDLPLEDSLAIFEEGVRLSRIGNQRLEEAELKVEELLVQQGSIQTKPLDDTNEEPT